MPKPIDILIVTLLATLTPLTASDHVSVISDIDEKSTAKLSVQDEQPPLPLLAEGEEQLPTPVNILFAEEFLEILHRIPGIPFLDDEESIIGSQFKRSNSFLPPVSQGLELSFLNELSPFQVNEYRTIKGSTVKEFHIPISNLNSVSEAIQHCLSRLPFHRRFAATIESLTLIIKVSTNNVYLMDALNQLPGIRYSETSPQKVDHTKPFTMNVHHDLRHKIDKTFFLKPYFMLGEFLKNKFSTITKTRIEEYHIPIQCADRVMNLGNILTTLPPHKRFMAKIENGHLVIIMCENEMYVTDLLTHHPQKQGKGTYSK
jgi:hypothetical protein